MYAIKGMFNGEIRSLLVQVISSWQVLAVTVVLVIYFSLVNYVARVYYRRPRGPIIYPKAKAETPEAHINTETDDLELEENKTEDQV